jgi:NAD(P)-dependent dehydrogenase (short-subunit alcohol dehydrogenase family)
VLLVARDEERGQRVADELGHAASFLSADVGDPASAMLITETALRRGRIDVLVNNAGIDFTSDLLEASEADVRQVMEINYFGALWLLQQVGVAMRDARHGSIINITSRLASIGVPTMGIYSASKGALLSLSRAAAVELAPYGIRVNAVAPGLTATPLFDAWVAEQPDPEEHLRQVLETIPQGRVGTPEDVAAAVAYLAADESAHVTGASIPIDGGYTAA